MNIKKVVKKCIFKLIRKVGRLFFGKNVWVICDREDVAGDNGEAFFAFLQNKPVKSYFAISADSPDYARIGKIGKTVNADSLFHKFLLCVSDVHVSSQLLHMESHEETYQIFLQHGVMRNNMSKYLNGVCHKNFYMITTGTAEKKITECEDYKFFPGHVWLTGMPRYDLLHDAREKKITVLLTWRMYIRYGQQGEACGNKYFEMCNRLLNDETLLDALEKSGYKLCFKLHPLMKGFMEKIKLNDRVMLWDNNYTEMFAKSAMLVTDYSSVDYDFAYLGKPVIYYQFDEDEFWAKHSYEKGTFDYRRDGLGEVVTKHEELKELILEYVENDCCVKSVYSERMQHFFCYRDNKNSERVYQMICKLLSNKDN